jgi:hypothetical protein
MALFFSTIFFGKNCLTKMPLTPIFLFFGLIRATPGAILESGGILEHLRYEHNFLSLPSPRFNVVDACVECGSLAAARRTTSYNFFLNLKTKAHSTLNAAKLLLVDGWSFLLPTAFFSKKLHCKVNKYEGNSTSKKVVSYYAYTVCAPFASSSVSVNLSRPSTSSL